MSMDSSFVSGAVWTNTNTNTETSTTTNYVEIITCYRVGTSKALTS